ncbi:hypothetical protein PM082_004495 [Marasmius tenuissimus]|nr:hypothetical protein PM082_004495 [Marasmius tenuissimus]
MGKSAPLCFQYDSSWTHFVLSAQRPAHVSTIFSCNQLKVVSSACARSSSAVWSKLGLAFQIYLDNEDVHRKLGHRVSCGGVGLPATTCLSKIKREARGLQSAGATKYVEKPPSYYLNTYCICVIIRPTRVWLVSITYIFPGARGSDYIFIVRSLGVFSTHSPHSYHPRVQGHMSCCSDYRLCDSSRTGLPSLDSNTTILGSPGS